MHKPSDSRYRSTTTLPMTVLLLLGVVFFGTYLVAERFAKDSLPPHAPALFIAVYVCFSAVAYLFFWLKERKTHGEQILTEALNSAGAWGGRLSLAKRSATR